ncbi:hypothetical protein EV196_110138 [Mariniflexile fucanivorans]|uniref:Uncharacterized protein n=1 Tax=Mariniflexile fucanivorans TaxID=264023 RepID=A0A4R1RBM1_9FLAO|nr:hypothetical protein EV196_110138 [Mariniflexile fucanivorans]
MHFFFDEIHYLINLYVFSYIKVNNRWLNNKYEIYFLLSNA